MTDYLYSKALEVGLLPSEALSMSEQELKDVINARYKQRQSEIYTMAVLIRSAMASVLNSENEFPRSANEAFGIEAGIEDTEGDWHRSLEYMQALAQSHNKKYRKGAR